MTAESKGTKKTPRTAEQDVGYLIKNLMHSLRQSAEAAFRQAGLELSMTQLATLFTIREEPGLPGAQIAKRLFITAQSMNDVLKTLEDTGLAAREAHPDNLRAHRWYITEKGSDKVSSSIDYSNAVFERMQSQLSEMEKLQFTDLLKRCIAGLAATDS